MPKPLVMSKLDAAWADTPARHSATAVRLREWLDLRGGWIAGITALLLFTCAIAAA